MKEIETHPLVVAAAKTCSAARQGLEDAQDYLSGTDTRDVRRMRTALGGVASACDALKAAANAYSSIYGIVSRSGGGD